MKKIMGLALALTLSLTLSAVAAEKGGTVKTVDPATGTFTLEDGTQLSVSTGQVNLQPGDQVLAAYETKDGKNVVTEVNRVIIGPDGRMTSNIAGHAIDRMNEVQGD